MTGPTARAWNDGRMPDELVVRRVGFAPVKGMRHLALDAVDLDEQGAVGDRSYCLVDVDEARVLRTVQHPSLVAVVARIHGDVLDLTLPTGDATRAAAVRTGRTLTCDYWGRAVDLELTDGPHAGLVSDWLGRRVQVGGRAPRRRGVRRLADRRRHRVAARARPPDGARRAHRTVRPLPRDARRRDRRALRRGHVGRSVRLESTTVRLLV